MEMFLPSEIARLVLGYLKEESCSSTIKCFLTECHHLSEYNDLLLAGREFTTNVGDLNLRSILAEYGRMKHEIKNKYNNYCQNCSNNNKNNNNGVKLNNNIFATPTSSYICNTPCISTPLSELVEIAGSMEKQLKSLVDASPIIEQHVVPHLLTFAGRHTALQQSWRSRHRILNKGVPWDKQRDSPDIINSNPVDKTINKDNNNLRNNINSDINKNNVNNINDKNESTSVDDDVNFNDSYNVKDRRTNRKRIITKKQNFIESKTQVNSSHDLINKTLTGRTNKKTTNTLNNKTKKNIKTTNNNDLEILGSSGLSAQSTSSDFNVINDPQNLDVLVNPKKFPVRTDKPKNDSVPLNNLEELICKSLPHSLDISLSETSKISTRVDSDRSIPTEIRRMETLVIDNLTEVKDPTVAEYFANFDSTLLSPDINDTMMSEEIGLPLHNSTSLVCIEEENLTPINFNQNTDMTIHSSSPDIFESQIFPDNISASSSSREFGFQPGCLKSLVTSPVIESFTKSIPTDVMQTISSSLGISSPGRSLKFRKLSHRIIAEHEREQSFLKLLQENSINQNKINKNGNKINNKCSILKRTSSNSNSISSTSEAKKFSEREDARISFSPFSRTNQIGGNLSESSEFGSHHIRDIVNFDDDSKTIDAPFSAPEISCQVVSSSRLIGSPEYSNSPASCPSVTPLKRPRDEPSLPPNKKKKKDLKYLDVETFLAKIHQR